MGELSCAATLWPKLCAAHNANMETVILRLCLTEAKHPLGFQFPVSAKDEKKSTLQKYYVQAFVQRWGSSSVQKTELNKTILTF